MNLYPHHWQTVERLKQHFIDDPRYLALIIGGSLVKGYGREDSDVDIVQVVTDEEFAKREPIQDLHYLTWDFIDYEGGYIDGKIVNRQFLLDVAERGSEPARWAFREVIIAYSHIPNLEAIIQRIIVYPEHERDQKMRSFYSQAYLHYLLGREAVERFAHNPYLVTQRVMEFLFYGGRLILAYNRMLYPYHKWFMTELEHAPEKPENLIALFNETLTAPTVDKIQAYWDAVNGFQDWGIDLHEAVTQFMIDAEWDWRDGKPALRDS